MDTKGVWLTIAGACLVVAGAVFLLLPTSFVSLSGTFDCGSVLMPKDGIMRDRVAADFAAEPDGYFAPACVDARRPRQLPGFILLGVGVVLLAAPHMLRAATPPGPPRHSTSA